MMDDLSREELITKCKHYLSLAQKAKQAKDGTYSLGIDPVVNLHYITVILCGFKLIGRKKKLSS